MLWNRAIETASRQEMERLQLARLQETVCRTYDRVTLFRQRCDAAGIHPEQIKRLGDLQRLPFLTKADLREQYPWGLFAEPQGNLARVHASSGTKGKPTVVPISGGNTPRQAMLIQDFRPNGIACTPSYALNIADYLDEHCGGARNTSLRYGIFGAEPWSESMREQLEARLGLDAIDIYGLSEVMGPGVSCECREAKHGLHINEDHFLPEVIDPATGEPLPDGEYGELVFTSLTKEAFPVIRYRTGDIAALMHEPCSCGRTLVRMTRVKGRVDDMLIIRGVNVYPSEVEFQLLKMPELAPHYLLVLERQGSMDVVEVTPEGNAWRQLSGHAHAAEADSPVRRKSGPCPGPPEADLAA